MRSATPMNRRAQFGKLACAAYRKDYCSPKMSKVLPNWCTKHAKWLRALQKKEGIPAPAKVTTRKMTEEDYA